MPRGIGDSTTSTTARSTSRARSHASLAFGAKNRIRLFEYLSAHPCVDCGETDELVLEFDHRDPTTKRKDVGYIAARKPWKFVAEEIAKCDVRCVNCHRKRTAQQYKWAKAQLTHSVQPQELLSPAIPIDTAVVSVGGAAERTCRVCGELKPITEFAIKNKRTGRRATICRACQRAYGREHYRRTKARYLRRGRKNKKQYRKQNHAGVLAYLVGQTCVDCGESNPVVLEFDHRDGVDKEAEIGRLIGSGQWGKVATEIAKCDVRCGNCHRRRTAEQFGWLKRTLQLARRESGQPVPAS